jgi:hypothetical protein
MALLKGMLYDPATAVSKATTALLALTAFDTTNLRLTFTAPTNGTVMVRMGVTHVAGTGAPYLASVLLGVLEGTTVRGRIAPNGYPQSIQNVSNAYVSLEGLFLVTGLTPAASYTWDAAYGVEVISLSTGGGAIRYGGPNNTTTTDAFGGFVYEIWDTA